MTSLSTGYNWTTRFTTNVGWNRRYFIEGKAGYDNPELLNHYLNVDTRLSTANNRFGSSYSMNFDVIQSRMTQQRINGYYNAQCCGIAVEYPAVQLLVVESASLPIIASSCRSRWPAWATSRRSAAPSATFRANLTRGASPLGLPDTLPPPLKLRRDLR